MSNDRCFVDSACWIALLNKHDNLHKTAETLHNLLTDETCLPDDRS
jgi:predicted nucleic acid-binding protein